MPAPSLRVHGRKIANWFAHLETLWQGIGDSLCGFRVYPGAPLRDIMERRHWMRTGPRTMLDQSIPGEPDVLPIAAFPEGTFAALPI